MKDTELGRHMDSDLVLSDALWSTFAQGTHAQRYADRSRHAHHEHVLACGFGPDPIGMFVQIHFYTSEFEVISILNH